MFEDDLTPPGVCVTCSHTVITAYELRTLVHTSQSYWSKALNVLDSVPENINQPVKSLCVFLKTENLSIQMIKDYEGGAPKIVLDRLSNRLKRKREKVPRISRAGPSCQCTDCGHSFNSPHALHLHLKNSGVKEACLLCGAIVLKGRGMKDHLEIVHKSTVYLCKKCPTYFEKQQLLQNHYKRAHKSGVFTCLDCGRTFLRKPGFESHAQMHVVRTCRACGLQFTNRGCYRKHRADCEPEAKPNIREFTRIKRSNIRDPATFICDYCNKIYHSRPQLKNHIIWIHMDVRNHECTECKKRFYTAARLTEHKVVHTRERNFECDICGARLVSKMAAVYHRRRHTGEKPYNCTKCDECFISASRRSEHLKRKHGIGLMYPCNLCSSVYVRTHELRKHIAKAHGLKSVANSAQITTTAMA